MKTTLSHQQKTFGPKVYQRILIVLPIAVGLAITVGFLGVSGSQAIPAGSVGGMSPGAPKAVVTETLVVGIDVPYWPYEYYSGTQIIGHDITLMNAVATEISVTVVYFVVPFDGLFDGLVRGDYDAVISALTVTPEREELIDFALPYETYYSPGGSGDLAIAVQQGDTSLRTQINEALFSLRDDGTLAAIIAATNVDLAQAYSDTWVVLPDWPEVPTDTETTLVYTDTRGSTTSIQVPGGAVSEAIVLEFTQLSTDAVTDGLAIAGRVFELEAYQDGAHLPGGYQFNRPITITVHYTDTDVAGLDEGSLLLQTWNEAESLWEDAACGPYDRHPDENWLAAPLCHLSRFALTGEEYHLYLPLIATGKASLVIWER
jgi:hypothetical protein